MARFSFAFIFDLDGVLTDTARLHLAAWRDVAAGLYLPFDEAMGEALKGVSRMASLELVLRPSALDFSDAEKQRMATRKNAAYVAGLAGMSAADLLPGAAAALAAVRAAGWGVALASASQNAPMVLERLGITAAFDHVVDVHRVARGKPDPEIFLRAAQALSVAPGRCIGIEDAVAGVQAIKAAGMFAVGIGDPQVLTQADVVLPDLQRFAPDAYLRQLR